MTLLATRSAHRRRHAPRLAAFVLLLGAIALETIATSARAAAPDWTIEITPDGELFPVLDLSQAPAESAAPGGGNGLVIVRVRGAEGPLRLVVETPGLEVPAVVETEIAASGKPIELRPRLRWDTAWLRDLKAPRGQALRLTLESAGVARVREVAVRVHPLDDALYFVREGRERIDLGWVFAAYVNPDDPVVARVVDDARAIDPAFDTHGDDPETKLRKARAIWAALTRHGLRYAAGDPALSRGPAIYSQRVRLMSEVWNERRANCLDGSVLLASVFERIGMPAFIALVPGHAFVGFRTGKGHAEFLETTLLGAGADSPRAAGTSAETDANFDAALRAGRARWRRTASRFDRRHAPDYALIDIGTARSYGIIPLGARGENVAGERAGPAAALPRKSSSQ